MEDKAVYTTKEAADYLGVSPPTIYRMEKRGLLSPMKTSGGQRRFSQKTLEACLRKRQSFKTPLIRETPALYEITTTNNNLVIVCVHVLNGQHVYHQTEGHILCEKCFKHYNSYGYDENGHWKIPKNEDLTNLRSVCRSCVNQIMKDKQGDI